MGEILKEFFVKIGLDNTQLKSGISDSKSALASFGKYFNGIMATYFSFTAMKDAITGFNALNLEIDKTSTLLGANAQDVAGAIGAFKRLGVESSEVTSSLSSLGNAFQQARFGGGALVEVSRRYGLSLGNIRGGMKNAGAVLERLSSQIGRYSAQTQKAILYQLGFGENMQYAFMSAGGSLKQLLKEQAEQAKNIARDLELSKKFKLAMAKVNDEFLKLKNAFARFVIPLLTTLADKFLKFIEFLKRHKLVVAAFFAGLAIAMMPVLVLLGKMALASATAFAPIVAIVATISAIALIFEDIYAYFMGWDSVTGDLVKKFPFLAESLEALRPVVLSIADVFNQIGEFFDNPNLENLQNIFTKILDSILIYFQETIGQAFMLAGDTIQAYLDAAWTSITGKIWRAWLTLTGELKSAFKSVCDFISNSINTYIIEPFNKTGNIIKGVFKSAFEYVYNLIQTYIIEPFNKVFGMLGNIGNTIKNVGETISGGASKAWGGVKSFFGFNDDEKAQNQNKLVTQPQTIQAIAQPQPPVISGATTNSSRYDNRVQNINVEVSGANLTDTGARDFGAGLAESINTKSQQNGDIGVF